MLKMKYNLKGEGILMKLLFSFIVFFFSSLAFQSQAQILIKYPIRSNMGQFDWSAFSDKETVRKQIRFENEIFKLLGPESIITGLNIGKLDLVQIEQELGLYKQGIKTGLSAEMMGSAEEAIRLHWGNINNIEGQIKAQAGLAGGVEFIQMKKTIGEPEDYYNGIWELYKGDHEIVFNMVEKKDEALYQALGGNDEAYAEFIAPYVQRYMEKMGETAQAYYDSLGGELDYEMAVQSGYGEIKTTFKDLNVTSLMDMYKDSVEIYKCFIKNFTDSEGGINQQKLMESIQSWRTNQALLGADSIIDAYESGIRTRQAAVTNQLLRFYEAPEDVRERIGLFLREGVLNNEEFIKADDRQRLGARVNALIGLNSFGIATSKEQELFNKAIEEGIIRYKNPHSFSRRALPLPE